MRIIIRRIYYWINALRCKMKNKRISISGSTEITNPELIEGLCKIGPHTYLKGALGKYSYIGKGCRIVANIGRFCSISNDVKTVEGKHPIDRISSSPVFYSPQKQCGVSFVNTHDFEEEEVDKPCNIGNDVWIGEHVIIKGGITIGNGAVIAMGAVVTKNVEPYSVVAGVPAREIKKRFCEDIINEIESTKWYEQSDEWLEKHLDAFKVTINEKKQVRGLFEKE